MVTIFPGPSANDREASRAMIDDLVATCNFSKEAATYLLDSLAEGPLTSEKMEKFAQILIRTSPFAQKEIFGEGHGLTDAAISILTEDGSSRVKNLASQM